MTTSAPRPAASGRLVRALQALALVVACLAVYANGFDHTYNLDSGYGLVQNRAVRDLGAIPRYFADPTTLTSLRSNADYRPVLQVTYALNYALSGYKMWSWHLVQVLLHVVCVLGVWAIARGLLARAHPEEGPLVRRWLPFAAALVFALHPVNAGVVDYLWARSSLLVAALLLPSFLLYLRAARDDAPAAVPWGALALYALALFAKVEAVAAVGVYALAEVLRVARREPGRARASLARDVLGALDRRTLRRLWPFLVVTLGYALVRAAVVPDFVAEARHDADVTGWDYLCTQLVAWWHYVARWFAPTRLVADDLSFPVYRSLLDPPVLLALAGWLLVAGLLRATYRRRPQYLLLALAALALVSPTSSFMPLAEMVNEHRPYLPLALLSLTWLVPAGVVLTALAERARSARSWLAACGLVLLVALFGLTWQRNEVFRTEEAYWLDVQAKAPSARSAVNLGLVRMRQGRLDEARRLFEAALQRAPHWHLVHVDLGVLYERLGRDEDALAEYDQAVAYERFTAAGRRYRGWLYLKQHRYGEARDDFEAALPLTVNRFSVYQGLATALAGLAQAEGALEATRRCLELDPERAETVIVGISTPFWDSEAGYEAGLVYFRQLDELMPGRPWIWENIATLARGLGREAEAEAAAERARALQ